MAQKNTSGGEGTEKGNGGSSAAFVKVCMDGAPYLRKVDLKMYQSYQELSDALAKMFSSFTMGKNNNKKKNLVFFFNYKRYFFLVLAHAIMKKKKRKKEKKLICFICFKKVNMVHKE